MKQKKKKTVNYVNNKELYENLIIYQEKCRKHEEEGKPKPRIPEYIGVCIWEIATRINNSPNFIGYSYRDEMIGDGIEHSIKYLHNFNAEKYNNPFAYFSTVCWRASQMRIKKEKKQELIKKEILKNSNYLDNMGMEQLEGDDRDFQSQYLKFLLDNADQKDKDDEHDKPKAAGKPGRKPKSVLDRQQKLRTLDDIDNEVKVEKENDSAPLEEFFDIEE